MIISFCTQNKTKFSLFIPFLKFMKKTNSPFFAKQDKAIDFHLIVLELGKKTEIL